MNLRSLALIVVACVILSGSLYLLGGFGSEYEQEIYAPPPPGNSSDPVQQVGDPSLIRNEIGSSLNHEETEFSCSAILSWVEPGTVTGWLLSETGERHLFSLGSSSETSVRVDIPLGRYSVHLEAGFIAIPNDFYINSGSIQVACFSGNSGNLSVYDTDNTPAGDVEVLARESFQHAWIPLGTTNHHGNLAFNGLGQITSFLFYKEQEFLAISSFPTGLHSLSTPLRFFIDDQSNLSIDVVSLPQGEAVGNATFHLGPLEIGTANSLGKFELPGNLHAVNELRVQAEGYLPEGHIIPNTEKGSPFFVANLRKSMPTGILVVSSDDDKPITGARIQIFSSRSGESSQFLWEGQSNKDGIVFPPEGFDSQAVIVGWHEFAGLGRCTLDIAIKEKALSLQEVAPLTLDLSGSYGTNSNVATCISKSFWGDSLRVETTETGSLRIPGALGAESIQLELNTGTRFLLERTSEFQRASSLKFDGLDIALAGNLQIPFVETSVLQGVLINPPGSILATDLLRVTGKPVDVGFSNFDEWPEMGGARPSTLRGWRWEDQSIRLTAFVNPEMEFEIRGVPPGRLRLHVSNMSRGGRDVAVASPHSILIPFPGVASINLEDSIHLDLVVKARDGQGNPINPILEFTSSSSFDSSYSNKMAFYSENVRFSIPRGQAQIVRVLASGFAPVELNVPLQGQGVQTQTVLLDRVEPMRIVIEDMRTQNTVPVIRASSGRYDQLAGLMMPMEDSYLAFDESLLCDFFGPFPGCDVYLLLDSTSNGELSTRWLTFSPGEEVTLQLRD